MDLLVPEVISLISKFGAYKGRIHGIVPFIGRKNVTLTARQQSYNDCTGGTGHALRSCLLGCGIVVWLGVAAPMSCTSQSTFCCISRNFAFAGKFVTPP